MKSCKNCGHGQQWHTKYGCLWHEKGTELLENVCTCNEDKK